MDRTGESSSFGYRSTGFCSNGAHEEQCNNFSTLSAVLKNQFGNNHQAELNRAHLRGCLKRRDKTLPELVEDIECLTRLAYPEAAEVMVIVLAKDQFIDALPDDDM